MQIYIPILNAEDRAYMKAALRNAALSAQRADWHSMYWDLRRFVSILTNFSL